MEGKIYKDGLKMMSGAVSPEDGLIWFPISISLGGQCVWDLFQEKYLYNSKNTGGRET